MAPFASSFAVDVAGAGVTGLIQSAWPEDGTSHRTASPSVRLQHKEMEPRKCFHPLRPTCEGNLVQTMPGVADSGTPRGTCRQQRNKCSEQTKRPHRLFEESQTCEGGSVALGVANLVSGRSSAGAWILSRGLRTPLSMIVEYLTWPAATASASRTVLSRWERLKFPGTSSVKA